jgi:uncharacterized protein (TIGR04255 family)
MENNEHLKQAIIRIDSPINFSFNEKLPRELEEEIVNFFPIPEPRELIGKEFQITDKKDEEITQKTTTIKEWVFFNKDKSLQLIISINYLAIVYKKQNSFEEIKEIWSKIITQLFKSVYNLKINRIGVRYINEITLLADKTKWKDHIEEKLLQNFNLNIDNISRGFSVINLNEEDGFQTQFQYGIHNPDFPSIIKNNIFILDYDVFFQGIISKDEVIRYIDTCKKKIDELYKKSVAN